MAADPADFENPDFPGNCRIEALKLTGFRNYLSLSLKFDARPIVLTGRNGAGKTNLLEAVSFLCDGRGLRGAGYGEIVGHKVESERSPGWAVWGRIMGPNGQVEIGTGFGAFAPDVPENRRAVRINGIPARSLSELGEFSRMIWLTPSMDGLFTGGASERRRFLDRLVVTVQPHHRRQINAFETAMRQRNALLGEVSPDPAWLDAIEAQMAEHAVSIAAARLETVELLSAAIAGRTRSAFPSARLELQGTVEQDLATMAAVDGEDTFRARLRVNRPGDCAAGRTLEGPHRADLLVFHGGHDIPARKCSTGEQKMVLIALILAHAGLVRELTSGVAPILLLDEIGAHLDAPHRDALYGEVRDLGAQAWFTGTDPGLFASLGSEAQHFNVEAGTVLPL
jgi:DNA replication and repair protein RecF